MRKLNSPHLGPSRVSSLAKHDYQSVESLIAGGIVIGLSEPEGPHVPRSFSLYPLDIVQASAEKRRW